MEFIKWSILHFKKTLRINLSNLHLYLDIDVKITAVEVMKSGVSIVTSRLCHDSSCFGSLQITKLFVSFNQKK